MIKDFKKFNVSERMDPPPGGPYELGGDYGKLFDKILSIFGVEVLAGGIIKVKNKMGKIICNMALRDNSFEKIDDNTYKLK